MKSDHLLARSLIALLLFALIQTEKARSATISFTPSVPTVAQGGSFTFDVYGISTNAIGGYSLYLDSSATGNEIELSQEALTNNFVYAAFPPSFPEPISTTATSDDETFSSSDNFSTLTSGLSADTQYKLSTYTVSIAAGTPLGYYTIGNTADSMFADPTFTLGDSAPAADFTIQVVTAPEPAPWALLMGGLGALLFYRSRRALRA